MEIEENRRIEEGRKYIESEEIKAKQELNNDLKEIEQKHFTKKTDNLSLYFMESIFVIIAPFVIISFFMEITWTNTILAFVCVLMWCAINIERKAIIKEQKSRREKEQENVLKKYNETLEELNEKRKEYLTEEEKEILRKEEEALKAAEIEKQKAEELRREEAQKRKYEKKLERQRKLNNFIRTLETIGAIARVLNMILDVILCIVFLPLGLLACFMTAVARSDNEKRRK